MVSSMSAGSQATVSPSGQGAAKAFMATSRAAMATPPQRGGSRSPGTEAIRSSGIRS